jgi:hypothetical protein
MYRKTYYSQKNDEFLTIIHDIFEPTGTSEW